MYITYNTKLLLLYKSLIIKTLIIIIIISIISIPIPIPIPFLFAMVAALPNYNEETNY